MIEDGTLDYLGLGHEMLADPYWPTKVKEGRLRGYFAPCVCCNECFAGWILRQTLLLRCEPTCYANGIMLCPSRMAPRNRFWSSAAAPAVCPLPLLPVSVAGMWRCGRRPTVWVARFWAAGGPDFKADIIKLINYMKVQCDKLGVKVRYNKAATAENVLGGNWDKVILAAGADPAIPPIPGIENATPVSEYLTHNAAAGKKVVVIGGGLAGTEAACDIAPNADEVTIVEMMPDILFSAAHCLNNDQHLRNMVKDRGVKVAAGAKVTKITPDSVTYEKDGETIVLTCDTVFNAAGFKANNQLEDLLEANYDNVTVIGDAIAPRKILTAVHEGYHAIRVME